jgi:hypothetical protein
MNNIKFINAKQAKDIHQYKNLKSVCFVGLRNV